MRPVGPASATSDTAWARSCAVHVIVSIAPVHTVHSDLFETQGEPRPLVLHRVLEALGNCEQW